VSRLYDAVQQVERIISARGLDPFTTKGQISMHTGFLLGFVAPDDQRELYLSAGCAIMPSRYEPWGVAIAEAAAAGLPVICTTACGASVELVRSQYTGLIVPSEDPAALAGALLQIEQTSAAELRNFGRHGAELAAAFGSPQWAARWAEYLREAARA
jgi:glycosyltransferase involved in cell wall biosynthesis